MYISKAVGPVCPANYLKSTDPSKSTAMVVWKYPSAVDANGKDFEVICIPPSGSEFPIGKTDVTCKTVDLKKEEVVCIFSITINGTLSYLKY